MRLALRCGCGRVHARSRQNELHCVGPNLTRDWQMVGGDSDDGGGGGGYLDQRKWTFCVLANKLGNGRGSGSGSGECWPLAVAALVQVGV